MNEKELRRSHDNLTLLTRSVYNRLCSALTDYELDPDTGFPPEPHNAGETLYYAILDIVNDMTNKMF